MRDRGFFNGVNLAGILIILATLVFLFSPPTLAQPACGNVGGGGIIDLSDLSLLIAYLYSGCPAPTPPATADMDGYTGVSFRDMTALAYKISVDHNFPLNCATVPPVYPTAEGTCISILNNPSFWADFGEVTCTLMVRFTDTLKGLTLPVKFFAGTDSALIMDARMLLHLPDSIQMAAIRRSGSTLHLVNDIRTMTPGVWLLAEVHLYVPLTIVFGDRPLRVEYSPITHCDNPAFDYASPWVYKLNPPLEVITPTLGCSCCAGQRGNINLQGIVDLADLSSLIRYLIADGGGLVCRDAANVNGEGIIDLADLSQLIAFLVGGGAPLAACP